MTDADMAYIIANKKRRSGFSEYSDHIVLIFPVLVFLGDVILLYLSVTNPSFKAPFSRSMMIFIESAVFILSAALFYFTGRRLRENVSFKSIVTPFSKSENYSLVTNILQQEKLPFEQFPGYIVCNTKISVTSWGEQIFLFPLDKEIMINSHPVKQPVTVFKDVKNIKKLEQQINEAVLARDKSAL